VFTVDIRVGWIETRIGDRDTEASPLEVEGIVDAEDADIRWLDDVPATERAFVEGLSRKIGLADVSATTCVGRLSSEIRRLASSNPSAATRGAWVRKAH
jgi:hypothetical protein